jgi:hypothetical protein
VFVYEQGHGPFGNTTFNRNAIELCRAAAKGYSTIQNILLKLSVVIVDVLICC